MIAHRSVFIVVCLGLLIASASIAAGVHNKPDPDDSDVIQTVCNETDQQQGKSFPSVFAEDALASGAALDRFTNDRDLVFETELRTTHDRHRETFSIGGYTTYLNVDVYVNRTSADVTLISPSGQKAANNPDIDTSNYQALSTKAFYVRDGVQQGTWTYVITPDGGPVEYRAVANVDSPISLDTTATKLQHSAKIQADFCRDRAWIATGPNDTLANPTVEAQVTLPNGTVQTYELDHQQKDTWSVEFPTPLAGPYNATVRSRRGDTEIASKVSWHVEGPDETPPQLNEFVVYDVDDLVVGYESREPITQTGVVVYAREADTGRWEPIDYLTRSQFNNLGDTYVGRVSTPESGVDSYAALIVSAMDNHGNDGAKGQYRTSSDAAPLPAEIRLTTEENSLDLRGAETVIDVRTRNHSVESYRTAVRFSTMPQNIRSVDISPGRSGGLYQSGEFLDCRDAPKTDCQLNQSGVAVFNDSLLIRNDNAVGQHLARIAVPSDDVANQTDVSVDPNNTALGGTGDSGLLPTAFGKTILVPQDDPSPQTGAIVIGGGLLALLLLLLLFTFRSATNES